MSNDDVLWLVRSVWISVWISLGGVALIEHSQSYTTIVFTRLGAFAKGLSTVDEPPFNVPTYLPTYQVWTFRKYVFLTYDVILVQIVPRFYVFAKKGIFVTI